MIMYLQEIKSTHEIPLIPLEDSKYKTEMIWSQLHLFDYYMMINFKEIKSTHNIPFIPLEYSKYKTNVALAFGNLI